MSSLAKRQREDAGYEGEVSGSKQFDKVNPANPDAIFETSMGTITCEIFLDKVDNSRPQIDSPALRHEMSV